MNVFTNKFSLTFCQHSTYLYKKCWQKYELIVKCCSSVDLGIHITDALWGMNIPLYKKKIAQTVRYRFNTVIIFKIFTLYIR